MSSAWEILGIGRTLDARAIRRAYAQLAKRYRPESHPKEFSELRDAYEAALREATVVATDPPLRSAVVERPSPLTATLATSAIGPYDLDDVSATESAWGELRARVAAMLSSGELGSVGATRIREVCGLVQQLIDHPANQALAIAALTEQSLLEIGASHDLPNAIASQILRHYGFDDLATGRVDGGLGHAMAHRQARVEHWRRNLDAAQRFPETPSGQLARGLTLSDKLKFWMNGGWRHELVLQLDFLRHQFPEFAHQLNTETVVWIDESKFHAVPRVSWELVATLLASCGLLWFGGASTWDSSSAEPWLYAALQVLLTGGLWFAGAVWFRTHRCMPLLRWCQDNLRAIVAVEICAAIGVLLLCTLPQKPSLFTSLAGSVCAAVFVFFNMCSRGSHAQLFIPLRDLGGTFIRACGMVVTGYVVRVMFPTTDDALLPWVGLVICMTTLSNPYLCWNPEASECTTWAGKVVSPQWWRWMAVTSCLAAFSSAGWLLYKWHNGQSIGADEFAVTGYAILLAATVFTLPIGRWLQKAEDAAVTIKGFVWVLWLVIFGAFKLPEIRPFLPITLLVIVYGGICARSFWVTSNMLIDDCP
jgi:hypothetical protein